MEEMKKDEALEEQQTTAEAAEAAEAEAVQAEEILDAVDETAEKIAKLEQQAADNLDKYQRTLAEFDNFRKRTIKEKAVMYDDGVRSTIEKLLTVIDNLERAVAVQEGKVDADDAFFKGVKMTLVQFREILHSMGVEEIKALGEKFDPNLHAAVAHEDDESYGENEVILEMLRRVGIKGGLGKVFEYVGPGAATLSVSERASITNMGAEMGATTSIFPADEQVRKFLKAEKREEDFTEILPDADAEYDGEMELNLSELVPLCACPHQPDNVIPLKDVEKKKVQQVFIGSCTNASYSDIAKAALVFKGRHVSEDVSCTCAISSKQIYKLLMRDGYIDMLLDAGVRLLEIACGPCCAIGQSPATKGVAVRTSNRNFKGRAGNPTAEIYLVSPESAAATAITGTFASAEDILGSDLSVLTEVKEPEEFPVDDSMIIEPLPEEEAKKVEIVRGPNIQPLPIPDAPEQHLKAQISLKTVDNITTDDITPASAEFSSMRSNIPLMSQYCYHRYDPEFAARAKAMGKSIIIGGENYGQGSSREHAAINPMYLGVKMVVAKSIARIHKGNLINHGIIPMVFADPADYDKLDLLDELEVEGLLDQMKTREVEIKDLTKGISFKAKLELSDNELEVILSGGQLRHLQKQLKEMEEK